MKTMRAKSYKPWVHVEYPHPGTPKLDADLLTIAKTHGGTSTGSGTGFGTRDLTFEFLMKKDARNARSALEKRLAKRYMSKEFSVRTHCRPIT